MLSLSEDTQSEVVETFTSAFRYLYDLLNIDRWEYPVEALRA